MGNRGEANLPLVRSGFSAETYLPLEFLRVADFARSVTPGAVRYFRSSGSTAATRSLSPYSTEGLKLYRDCAISDFQQMLVQLKADPHIPGISLVPPPNEWPDSSLAQMIEWIAETNPVTYWNIEKPFPKLDRPHFVFGTGFHFVSLSDRGFSSNLVSGSLVIETGGTKGKSRDVTRLQLHAMIQKMFGLPSEAIVSEYGMCELAIQAYEYWENNRRRFRFFRPVEARVTTGNGEFSKTGQGALTILDPLRIDLPHPIRTEDLVELFADGSFELLGRIPKAPLKGCSTIVEDLVESNQRPAQKWRPNTLEADPSSKGLKLDSLRTFLEDRSTISVLQSEMGVGIAKSALDDLVSDIPETETLLNQSLENSMQTGDVREPLKKWLFILPNSHPIAAVYPLFMAAMLKQPMVVRLPANCPDDGFTMRFIRLCASSCSIETIGPEFRIGIASDLPDEVDSVFVFGMDETIENLQKILRNRRVIGYGHMTTAMVLDLRADLPNPENLVHDWFCLRQRGCLSVRSVIAIGDTADLLKEYLSSNELNQAFKRLCPNLTTSEKLSLEQLRVHPENDISWQTQMDADSPFYYLLAKKGKPQALDDLYSDTPFAMPFVWVDSIEKAIELLKSSPSLRLVTSSQHLLKCFESPPIKNKKAQTIRFVRVGRGNRMPWDGTSMGQRLFSVPKKTSPGMLPAW